MVGGPVPECQEFGRQEVGDSLSFVKAEEEEAVSGPPRECRENEDRGLRRGDTVKWASKAESPPLVCQTAKGEGPGVWMGAGAGVVERGLKQRTMGMGFSMDKTRRPGEIYLGHLVHSFN